MSLSGSESAVGAVYGLRKTHETDPIAPLYRALSGVPPRDILEELTPGGFDEHMAHATAREVMETYAEVQDRYYSRCPVRHGAG